MKVLVLSMQDDPRYVREAFDAGASGYVLKEAADTEVVAAVKAVAAGERYVNTDPRRQAASRPTRRSGGGPSATHSEREREVLPGHAGAHEPGDRADALHLGPHGRDPPRAHHAEAAAAQPRGASSATRSRRA